ncbi:aminodeoxychorismate synthase, glutamine amidotransferase subunit [Desulfacinum hydrothermale DSM 13146]|uniref:Aminodeoxychorismate synthase, glutamine amidotransferase subunit n=1 Tax=Desulfacinum hydrothermale DSM 13146 TaxID=1121390 RepID=A0A1W1X2J5_9BACT|nr:aminodeoxychorismate/anthranilate synthase component II [Desulfacinum hydrothermale]SMC18043.1 aminodeoxychorismate synthase, glutamine amidotransferase subunit [Desulfacinum hydrothermale DSM 13146]
MQLVLIDNYDSFTYNLYQLFLEFQIDVRVYRHDVVTLQDLSRMRPDWICISPGPKDPRHAGISIQVVRAFQETTPILGVCLGMQVINEAYGGQTTRAPVPLHGKRCRIHHGHDPMFSGIPSPFWVARYHSLQCADVPPVLVPTAWADDGVLMALRHQSLPVWGVQFHPESFLSEFGLEVMANFLSLHPNFCPDADLLAPQKSRFPRWLRPEPPGSEMLEARP